MLRCAHLAAPAAAFVASIAFTLTASADVHRNFPGNALRGELRIGQPPSVLLNGEPARLAPGARIHGENNMIVMSGAIAGTEGVVDYTVDSSGLVKEVWILTPDERARRPWPRTVAQQKAWSFDFGTQTWTKP